MLSTERRRHDVHVLFGDISYDFRNAQWRVNNKIKRKFTLFQFHIHTRENTDVFITLDDNIFMVFTEKE